VRSGSAACLCFLGRKENIQVDFKSPVWKLEGIATNVQSDYFLNCYEMTVVGKVIRDPGRSRVSNMDRGKNLFSQKLQTDCAA
jgi:hypothetical protein